MLRQTNQPAIVTFELSPEISYQEMDGIEYMIAPAVIVMEAVLNGELVPGDEIAAYVEAWNNTAIIVGPDHPKDEGGNYISANADPYYPRFGQLFNSEWIENGRKLAAEMWINKAKLEASEHGFIANKLIDGEIVELSSAFFRDIEPRSGIFGGKKYGRISRNLRPDHVIILTEGRGACSVNMGCGVPRVNSDRGLSANQETDFSNSVMIALYPQRSQAADLVLTAEDVPGAELILPVDDLHVTLAYLGEIDTLGVSEGDLLSALSQYASYAPLVYADVQGGGYFDPRAEGGSIPFFAHLTSNQLLEMRQSIVDWVLWDQSISGRHMYQPHLTLCYFPPSERLDVPTIPRQSLVFDSISLSWGDRITHFPLQGSAEAAPVSLSDFLQGNHINQIGENDMSDSKEQLDRIEAAVSALAESGAAQAETLADVQTAVTNQGARLEAVETIAANIQQKDDDQKNGLISQLSANKNCPLPESALKRLELAELQALEAAYLEEDRGITDYVGRAGAIANNSDDGWEEYNAPA